MTEFLKRVAVRVCCLGLMGCALVAQAQPEAGVNAPMGEAFKVPRLLTKQQSRVVFYRLATDTDVGVATVYINGGYQGSLQPGAFTQLCLPPRTIEVAVRTVQNEREVRDDYDVVNALMLEAGQDVFVRVSHQDTGRAMMVAMRPEAALPELVKTRSQQHTLTRVPGAVACKEDPTRLKGADSKGPVRMQTITLEAYINWARSIDLFNLAVKNLESHSVTLEDIRKIVAVDTGRQIDLQQAQVRMDNAALVKLQRETELSQARQRLMRFWLGQLPTKPLGLTEALSANGRLGQQVPRSIDQVLSVVTDDLPNVAQQVKQVQAAESAVSMARGQYSPTVDFTSARQLNLSGVAPYKQDTFSQVQVNMPLYNGGATSAGVDAAVSQLKAAQFALDEARLLAREKATVSYHEWVSTQGRAVQGASQAKVGDKVVDGYRQQFRLGRRQLLDLLNIQAEAFGYQSSATTAFYDEQVARARLLAATGDLAKRF